jgi:hypothetical protein
MPALRRLRQEDCEFKARWGYIMILGQKQNKNKQTKRIPNASVLNSKYLPLPIIGKYFVKTVYT